jgi:Uma2 family endonuclease
MLMEMPDDGVEREIINGRLVERRSAPGEPPMTRRNWNHSGTEAAVAKILGSWSDAQPKPRGKVVSGEAGFRLKADPDTLVGIDVAYVSAEMLARRDRKFKFGDEPPVLAVEILSPSDQHEDVVNKVKLYLEVGTVVWVVDPDFRIVTVHQPGRPIEVYRDDQEIHGDSYLPGFRARVGSFFED